MLRPARRAIVGAAFAYVQSVGASRWRATEYGNKARGRGAESKNEHRAQEARGVPRSRRARAPNEIDIFAESLSVPRRLTNWLLNYWAT